MNNRILLSFTIIAVLLTLALSSAQSREETSYAYSLTGFAAAQTTRTPPPECIYTFTTVPDVNGTQYTICWYGKKIVQEPCSCPSGTSIQPPDPNDILAQLNQHRCVNGASIDLPIIRKSGCPDCYGKINIKVVPGPLVCQTKCGPVECDGSATIPCPDKPNCQLTCKCTWGGWQQIGQFKFAPKVG